MAEKRGPSVEEEANLAKRIKLDEDSAQESLNETKSASSTQANHECRVCLEKIDDASRAELACSHGFHLSCIQTWTSNHNTCPYCKAVVTKIEFDYDPKTGEARQSSAVTEPQPELPPVIFVSSTLVTRGVTLEFRAPTPIEENYRIINTSTVRSIQLVGEEEVLTEVLPGEAAFVIPDSHIAVRIGQRQIELGTPMLAVVQAMFSQIMEQLQEGGAEGLMGNIAQMLPGGEDGSDSDSEEEESRPAPTRRTRTQPPPARRTRNQPSRRGGRSSRGGRGRR